MALSREITTQITNLLKEHPQGLSITDIVKKIDINRNTAGRYLENLLISGQVEMRHFGMAKIYALSDRIPQSAMLSISSDLVMQLDSSLRIVFANEPFLNALRVTAADLLGKNIEYSAAVPVFEEALKDFIQVLKAGISGIEWHGTLALNKGDRFYSCHITPMVFNDGRKGVSVLLEDLTELRHREIALQESEERLRSIIRAAPVGIGVVSERVIIEANERLSRMTGYSIGELMGNSARMLYPTEEEFEKVGSDKYALIDQTGTGTVQTRWIKKDGSIIDILLSSAPLNPDDLSRGVTFTALDITSRTRTEQALRESEERYRNLAEGSNDLIYVIGRDDRVEYVNSFSAAVFKKSAEDIIGSRRTSLFPPEVARNQKERLDRVFESGVPAHSEGPLRINDRVCWFDHFLMPSKDPDGQVRSVLGISRDITDRRRTEDALRESEQKYRGVIENIQDVFYRVDTTGTITMASPSITGMFGYDSVNEALGQNLAGMFMDPAQREVFLTLIKTTGSVRNFESVLKRKDGTPVIVSTSSHFYYDANGTILGIEGISKDITEWKHAEQAMRESEERFRKLVEISPDAILLHRDGIIMYTNAAACMLLGAPHPAELIGKTLLDFIEPGFREVVKENIRKDLNGEESPQTELKMLQLDGTSVIIEGRGVKTIIDGKPAVLVALRDITGRTLADEKLRESERKYRFLAENSLDIINRQTPECVLTYVSPSVTQVLGYSEEEVLGKSVLEMVHPEDIEQVRQDLIRIISTGLNRVTSTFRFRHRDGQYLWFESTTNIIRDKESGKIQELFSISRDITERKAK